MIRAIALCVALMLVVSPALATEEGRVGERYRFILAELEQGEGNAALWWNGWTFGFAAATVGQTVLALAVDDRGWRIDNAVGAATSGLGAIGTALEPRTPITAAADLRAMDASTPAARALRLRRAEQLLRDAAQEELDGRSWFPHVAGAATTLAASAVLWYGYDRYSSGWLNLLGGTLVTELQIASRPTAAVRAYRAYYQRHAGAAALAPRTWWIRPQGLGVGVGAEL
ncbi:MAG: hypothetical protein HYZ29_00250 [Myxococcales bacterium]|nr:hypothetical protein [Myxococcales bacterium]